MADFIGTIGPDDWVGTSGADTAHGGEGDDTLKGEGGNDSIFGEGGNDVLYGGPGVDLLDGGAGDDRLVVFMWNFTPDDLESGDQFIGGSGTDELYFTANYATVETLDLTGFTFSADIERLNMTQFTAQLTLAQLGQFSRVSGIFALTTSGTIDLTGNRFADGRITFADGDDIVTMAGNIPTYSISMDGAGGNDQLIGSEHHDLLIGGIGNDLLEGRGGIDSMEGGAGDDVMLGGDGDDSLFDGEGADVLNGGAGNDIFHIDFQQGFSAADQLIGGSGVDRIWVSGFPVGNTIDLATISEDIEGLEASSVSVIATAEQLSRFVRLDVANIRMTTGGNIILSGNLTFRALQLADFATSVDLSSPLGFGGFTVDGGAAADTMVGSIGVDFLTGAGGDDVIHGGGSFDRIIGGAGVDWIDGGGADDLLMIDSFEVVEAGDRFTGGDGVDQLLIQNGAVVPADLTIATIDGDIERLEARREVIVTVGQLAGFTQIDAGGVVRLANGGAVDFTGKQTSGKLVLSDLGNQVTLTESGFEVTGGAANDSILGALMLGNAILSGGGGNDIVIGGGGLFDQLFGDDGNDRIEGGAGDDLLDGGTGADEMLGGAGADFYRVDSAGDSVIELAGQGLDRVSATDSFALGADSEVETIEVASGSNGAIDLTGSNTNNTMTGGQGNNRLDGRGGNDIIDGGAGDDLLYSGEGVDRLQGGDGSDGLYFGATFTSADSADGGFGVDTLALQGGYAGFSLGNVTGIEVLFLVSGQDSSFGDTAGNLYDYSLVAPNGLVGAGRTLTVIAGELRPGEDLNFNGAAETDGFLRIFAGRGNDTLVGGTQGDGFFFGAVGNLTGADRINGGAGTDSIALRGNYVGDGAVVFENASFANIEVLTFLSGHGNEYGGLIDTNGFDYDVTLADGNVAAGLRLDVIASTLRANESVRFDARGELDGSVRLLSGAGNDTLFGSAGADFISGGLGADAIDGSGGNDLYVYRNVNESTAIARDTVAFGAGDKIDLSVIDANSTTVGPNEAFAFIGSAAFSNVAGQLRAVQSGAEWIVEGDVNGDGLADLVISGIGVIPLTAADFVL